jgi:hypothetical protein
MRCRSLLIAGVFLLISSRAHAVRPFITDDARVVGDRAAQVESWLRLDRKTQEHWVAAAIGPVEPLEFSLGMVHGLAESKYTLAAPLLQFKVLARETTPGVIWPGVALVAGTLGPYGTGELKGEIWDNFGYLALSESLDSRDHVLFHQNLGLLLVRGERGREPQITWGVGTQIHLFRGLHFVGEVFSGDPYATTSSGAFQVGGRHFLSRFVQLDATLGRGLWGGDTRLPLWGSVGIRIASDPYWF